MFCALTMTAHSQVQIGVKGGLNISEILTSGNPATIVNGTTENMRYFPKTSVNGGVFFSIPLAKKWYLQPELAFSMQGATGRPEENYFVTATEDYKLSYLNVPILVKYKLPLGFFVETGPQVGLLLSANDQETLVGATSNFSYNVKSHLKSTDLSWALGTGYCSPFNVGFDIRYNLGLSNISNVTPANEADAPVPNGTLKNSVVQIGVFYLFGKKTFNPPVTEE